MASKVKPTVRIVVIGNQNVGKTSLVTRYVDGTFAEKYDVSTDLNYHKHLEVCDHNVVLEFIDFAGTERTESRELAIKNGHGFLFVYSITDLDSFNALTELREHILSVKDTDVENAILIGNKTDLHESRIVTTEQGTELARKFNNCQFLEASAKTQRNDINFDRAIKDMVATIRPWPYVPPDFNERNRNCVIV